MNIYVIYDRLAEESGPLFEAKNDAVARRSMLSQWKNKGVELGDVKLLRLGTVDHATQRIVLENVPVDVVLLQEVSNG